MQYIVLGSNDYHQVQAFGPESDDGEQGIAFDNYEEAEAMAEAMKRKWRHCDYLVLDINPMTIEELTEDA